MDCAANYSPWGALRGVEMELNGDNEKVHGKLGRSEILFFLSAQG